VFQESYAGGCPATPGITSPLRNVGTDDLDWVIVRENSEGEYSGHGGRAIAACPRRAPRLGYSRALQGVRQALRIGVRRRVGEGCAFRGVADERRYHRNRDDRHAFGVYFLCETGEIVGTLCRSM